jgi:hypothetical protein
MTVWMCVVWPRVHTLKDCNYQMRNLDSCRRWRCMLCPCKVRNKFFIHLWNRTILLCMPCSLRSHWDETKLHYQTQPLRNLFIHYTPSTSRLPVFIIQFCFKTCLTQFVSHSCLILMQVQQLFAFLGSDRDTPVSSASVSRNIVGDFTLY